MLWMKSWYEVRLRFLAGFILVGGTLFIRRMGSPVASRQDAVAIMGATSLLWILFSFYLSGAGVKTQSAFSAVKGLHGSTYYTLSLPVSRFQLLTVRATIRMERVRDTGRELPAVHPYTSLGCDFCFSRADGRLLLYRGQSCADARVLTRPFIDPPGASSGLPGNAGAPP